MTRDAEASAKFYAALFGWTREDKDMGGSTYAMFKTKGRPVGGMVVLPPEAESMPVMWMGYVTVENLEASIAKAVELGAEVHKGSRQSRWAASPFSPILKAPSSASGSLLPETRKREFPRTSLLEAFGRACLAVARGVHRCPICLRHPGRIGRKSSNWFARSSALVRSLSGKTIKALKQLRRLEKSTCIRQQSSDQEIFFSEADGLVTQPKG